jgi:Thioredoxin
MSNQQKQSNASNNNFEYTSNSPLDVIKANPKPFIITLIIFVILTALSFGISYYTNPARNAKIASEPVEIIRNSNQNHLQYGKKDANVQVLFVEDISCPGCQSFTKGAGENPGMSKIKETFKDTVGFNYKFIQIIPEHTYSPEATRVILAVNKLYGKGVEFSDFLYKNVPSMNNFNAKDIEGAISNFGFNQQEVYKTASSQEIIDQYNQDEADQENYTIPVIDKYTNKETKITGTPTVMIFVKNKLVKMTLGNDGAKLLIDPTNTAEILVADPTSIATILTKLVEENK